MIIISFFYFGGKHSWLFYNDTAGVFNHVPVTVHCNAEHVVTLKKWINKNCNCSQDFYPNSYNTTENSPEWTSSLEPRAWLGDLSKWHWHCQPALLLISPLLKSNNVPGLWSCKCETPYSWKTKHKQKNNNTQLS